VGRSAAWANTTAGGKSGTGGAGGFGWGEWWTLGSEPSGGSSGWGAVWVRGGSGMADATGTGGSTAAREFGDWGAERAGGRGGGVLLG
jgi:hypothetical protein